MVFAGRRRRAGYHSSKTPEASHYAVSAAEKHGQRTLGARRALL